MILIVDDSKELLEVLAIILEKHGHRVITKNDPQDISKFVQQIRPACFDKCSREQKPGYLIS